MKVIDWLLSGDPVIECLTRHYILNQPVEYIETGYLGRYLSLYIPEKSGWGYGLYSPKWISDHYTLLELMEMEINPQHPFYQESVRHLLSNFWYVGLKRPRGRHFDMCIAGMFLSLASYGKIQDFRINEIVDYILEHMMKDGGWNCSYDAVPTPSNKSSLHTTLTILEAFHRYQENGYQYRIDEVIKAIVPAQNFIISKRFFRSQTTNEVIDPRMQVMHYPPRWYYDAPRALLYFQSVHFPYVHCMQETLDYLKSEMEKGYLKKDQGYANLKHFLLERGAPGRFNTLRALIILKEYQPTFYNSIIEKDFQYPN